MTRRTNDTQRKNMLLAGAALLIGTLILLTRHLVALENDPWSRLAWQLFGYGGIAISALALPRYLAFGPVDQKAPTDRWFNALLFVALAVVLGRFVTKHPPGDWSMKDAQQWCALAEAYIVGRLVVPVTEELLFRGVLWSSLAREQTSGGWVPTLPTIISALVFGALHWPTLYGLSATGAWVIIVSASLGGIVFGVLRQVTGSIRPAIALHIIGNSIGF